MKFGFYIRTQQEENSDLHYVEYALLKKRIKDVVAKLGKHELSEALTANTAFEQELAAEIRQVNDCFEGRQMELLQRIASLSEDIQQEGAAVAITSSSACSAEAVEAPKQPQQLAAFHRLVDLLKEVDRLRKFAVWNAVSVVKILKKRRKQTSFGLEDSSAERSGWLSRQSFFSGSEFAELHAAIESLGRALVLAELAPASCSAESRPQRVQQHGGDTPEQCPICLESISDMVELDCQHRFCWKCFVLGPIAHQPGEYRMSQCPICRKTTTETTKPPELEGSDKVPTLIPGVHVAGAGGLEGMLGRFLHTYFPQNAALSLDAESDSDGGSEDGKIDVVGELVKVVLKDHRSPLLRPSEAPGSGLTGAPPSDFFQTLPAPKPEQEQCQMRMAQKLQWLQLASSNDPFATDEAMYCTLCSEPLLLEAVATTPCKHHFHQICIKRLDMPECPLCQTGLPFKWFLPADHPLAEKGFRVVPPNEYRPRFPGGPSKGSCGFTLRRPPPANLQGPNGMMMRSYLHRIPPMGPLEDGEQDSSEGRREPSVASTSESSSEESNSEDNGNASAADSRSEAMENNSRNARGGKWVYSAVGRMRFCKSDGMGAPTQQAIHVPTRAVQAVGPSFSQGIAASCGASDSCLPDPDRRLLRIGDHL